MKSQRGGRFNVRLYVALALGSAALLYAFRPTPAPYHLTPASPPQDYNVHSWPDDENPPPCGAFNSICYSQTAYSDKP